MKILKLIIISLFLPFIISAQFGPRVILAPNLTSPRINIPVDLDNDGDMDILTSSTEGNRAWFENLDGQGNFSQSITIISDAEGGANIHEVDWDNDGDMDILAGSFSKNEIQFYENVNQEVTFAPVKVLASNFDDPGALATKDIDNDGDLDLLAINYSNFDQLFYFKNDGNGNLESPVLISSNLVSVTAFDLGDLDGDGDLDILFGTGNINGSDLHWHENVDGLGNFAVEQSVSSSGFSVSGVAIIDIDGNGSLDPVYSTSSNSKVIWVPNDNGIFSPEQIIGNSYFYAGDVAVVDVDGDLDFDVVSCSGSSGEVSWWEHLDGNGTFGNEITAVDSYDNANKIAPADFDNDGDIDFLVTGISSDHISWIENTDGLGTFEKHLIYDVRSTGQMTMGDLNNDGFLDIKTFSDTYIYNPSKNGYDDPINLSTGLNDIILRDVDGDNDLDAIGATSNFYWLENIDGQGNLGNQSLIIDPSTINITNFIAEDIDSDGDVDLLFTSTPSDKLILVENLDGLGNFGPEIEIDNGINAIESVLATDLDGDGDLDLVITGNNPDAVALLENLGPGNGFSTPVILLDNIYFPAGLATGDLDGDNDLDLIVGGYGGKLYWLNNLNGGLEFGPPGFIYEFDGSNSGVDNIRLFDYDNDGDQDIIYDDGCCGNESVAILENTDGAGNFQEALVFDIPVGPSKAIEVTDFDFDGDIDIIVSKNDRIEIMRNYADDPHLNGRVFWDKNENGILDSTEVGMNEHQLSIQPIGLLNWTFDDGYYSFPVAPNDYELSCQPNENWKLTSDSIFNLTITSNLDTLIHNFGVRPITDTTLSKIALSSGPTRCGFTVPFWMNYSVNSFQTENGFVQLKLDSLVTFLSSTPAPDVISDSLLIWNITDVFPFSSNQIKLEFEIAGVDFLGKKIHLESVIVTEDSLSNITSTDTLLYQSTINCSYDPNDKLVVPSITGYDNYTLFGTDLSYTVRFQNTGTDTAFNIRIEDKLDTNLDWSTFQVISSSHPVSSSLDQYGNVIFRFDDILLPWSQIDETGSQGFVKYEISPKEPTNENTLVFNTANIFFDFNPPIITNTVSNIYVSQLPVISTTKSPSCVDGNDGSITIHLPSSGFAFFDWSNGASGSQIENLAEGIYTVTVTDANGQVLNIENITVPPADPIQISGQIIPANGSTVYGEIDLNISGGSGFYDFVWDTQPSQTTATISNLLPGQYQVTVTDNEGCVNVESFSIELEFESSFIINSPNCYGLTNGSIQSISYLDSLGYQWSNNTDDDHIQNLGAGNYFVTISDVDGQILSIDSITLTVPDEIINSITTAPSNGSSQFGTAEINSVGGTPPFEYIWNTTPSQTGPMLSNLVPGMYQVTVTDANGCSQIENVTIDLEYAFEAEIHDPLCFDSFDGAIEVLSIWDLITYQWSTGSTSNNLGNVGIGTYDLSVFDPMGNILIDTSITLNSPPFLELITSSTPSEIDSPTGSATVSATGGIPPYSYLWNTPSPQVGASIINVSAGTYSVVVTDANNCSKVVEVVVDQKVGIEDLGFELIFDISPNPSLGEFLINIETPNTETWELVIYNATGIPVKSMTKESVQDLNNKVKIENLPAGIYHVSLITHQGIFTKKILVFKE